MHFYPCILICKIKTQLGSYIKCSKSENLGSILVEIFLASVQTVHLSKKLFLWLLLCFLMINFNCQYGAIVECLLSMCKVLGSVLGTADIITGFRNNWLKEYLMPFVPASEG